MDYRDKMLPLMRRSSAWLDSLMPYTDFGDKVVALKRFLRIHRRFPRDPSLFNDALYFIKTGDEVVDPLRVFVTDKEFVKTYVKAVVGDAYNVPTLAVLRSPADVEHFTFPDSCCIKPTHVSGQVIFRQGACHIDIDRIIGWFGLSHYRKSRERNYKTLRPKVIVEPILFNQPDITDYRFFCYRGEVRLISLDIGKYSNYTRAFYDPDWNVQPFSLQYPRHETILRRPANLEEMKAIARRLSAGFNLVRVDIYSNGVECFVGELTHCHASAGQRFVPLSAERVASDMIFK